MFWHPGHRDRSSGLKRQRLDRIHVKTQSTWRNHLASENLPKIPHREQTARSRYDSPCCRCSTVLLYIADKVSYKISQCFQTNQNVKKQHWFNLKCLSPSCNHRTFDFVIHSSLGLQVRVAAPSSSSFTLRRSDSLASDMSGKHLLTRTLLSTRHWVHQEVSS